MARYKEDKREGEGEGVAWRQSTAYGTEGAWKSAGIVGFGAAWCESSHSEGIGIQAQAQAEVEVEVEASKTVKIYPHEAKRHIDVLSGLLASIWRPHLWLTPGDPCQAMSDVFAAVKNDPLARLMLVQDAFDPLEGRLTEFDHRLDSFLDSLEPLWTIRRCHTPKGQSREPLCCHM